MTDTKKESDTMSPLQHARSFRDLIVYQKARGVAKRVFEITKRFPREEMYSLTDHFTTTDD